MLRDPHDPALGSAGYVLRGEPTGDETPLYLTDAPVPVRCYECKRLGCSGCLPFPRTDA